MYRPIWQKHHSADEINQRGSKWIKRHAIFIDWKVQYSIDVISPQMDIQLQWDS